MHKLTCCLLAAALFVGCTSRPMKDERTLYVSILPLRSLVKSIVGDDFDIRILVPAGASPETFELTPRQFVDLNRADMIFNVGLIDFENTLLGKVEAKGKIINLSVGIPLLAGNCSHPHPQATGSPAANGKEGSTGTHRTECGHEDGLRAGTAVTHKSSIIHAHPHGIDPHVWTSPKALLQMAATAYEAIHAAYPDSAKYTANYQRLRTQLQELDARTGEKIARSGVEYFIIYHPALSYYARDYGLRQVAIEDDGKEPSARRLSRLIRDARRDGIRTVFYQSQFPASAVEVIARDIDARSVEIDPLREDVIANIDAITDLIVSQ